MLSRIPQASSGYQIVTELVYSPLLAQNKAGMDPRRPVTIFIPAAENPSIEAFPVLYCLAPWTNAGRGQMQWESFRENLPDRLNRLMTTGAMPPALVVCPDLYNDFGGSQYINSTYMGNHGDHIVHELLPFIEQHYPVLPGAQHRGVFGRSSGGFGALRLAMDYPGVFSAIACHSGDLGFETSYRRDLIELCYGLARYRGSVPDYFEALRKQVKHSGKDIHLLSLLGMAAFYSPSDSALGYDLPVDLVTGEVIENVWQKWLTHDPVVRAKQKYYADALKTLKFFYIDCGNRDQYHLHFGARQLKGVLREQGIAHDYYEFEDNHSGTSYRYDVSLPLMLKALTASRS